MRGCKVFNLGVKGFIFLSVSLFIMFISSCEKDEVVSRSYPRVRTLDVSEVSLTGATIRIEITSLGNEEIVDYGYFWSEIGCDLGSSSSTKISLGAAVNTGVLEYRIISPLKRGVRYQAQPYIQTVNRLVYGAVVTFNI